jgi:hypothetical protein
MLIMLPVPRFAQLGEKTCIMPAFSRTKSSGETTLLIGNRNPDQAESLFVHIGLLRGFWIAIEVGYKK